MQAFYEQLIHILVSIHVHMYVYAYTHKPTTNINANILVIRLCMHVYLCSIHKLLCILATHPCYNLHYYGCSSISVYCICIGICLSILYAYEKMFHFHMKFSNACEYPCGNVNITFVCLLQISNISVRSFV